MKLFKATLARGALALMCAAAISLPAQAQGPAPVNPDRAKIEASAIELFAKAKLYQEMVIEAQEIVLDVVDHVNVAFEMSAETVTTAEANTWSEAWAVPARARLAALKARLASAPRVSETEARRIMGPKGAKLARLFAEQPQTVTRIIEVAEKAMEQAVEFGPLAATGDEDAVETLLVGNMNVSILVMDMENEGLKLAIASMSDGHPQRSLTQSALALNNGAMELLMVVVREMEGDPADQVGADKRMRAFIDEATVAARRVPREAKARVAAMQAEAPDISESFFNRVRKAFDTYAQSAEVELEIARLMTKAADALAADDEDATFAALDAADPLYDKRIALQTERATHLTE